VGILSHQILGEKRYWASTQKWDDICGDLWLDEHPDVGSSCPENPWDAQRWSQPCPTLQKHHRHILTPSPGEIEIQIDSVNHREIYALLVSSCFKSRGINLMIHVLPQMMLRDP
jgi:hypothetical protein